jgi:hypothetical protein
MKINTSNCDKMHGQYNVKLSEVIFFSCAYHEDTNMTGGTAPLILILST